MAKIKYKLMSHIIPTLHHLESANDLPSDHQNQALELNNITLNDASNKKLSLMPSFRF
jgi:hypothetical protein